MQQTKTVINLLSILVVVAGCTVHNEIPRYDSSVLAREYQQNRMQHPYNPYYPYYSPYADNPIYPPYYPMYPYGYVPLIPNHYYPPYPFYDPDADNPYYPFKRKIYPEDNDEDYIYPLIHSGG